MNVRKINSAGLQLIHNETKTEGACHQIGPAFLESGLADIFDIRSEDNLNSPENMHKKAILLGFLTEAAMGELSQPEDIERLQLLGLKLIEDRAE